MRPALNSATLLCTMLLAGCLPPAPSGEAVAAAVAACERSGGNFRYFHGGTVHMECNPKAKQ